MLINVDEVLEPNIVCDECLDTIECYETCYEIIIDTEIITLCEHCYMKLLTIMQDNVF